jgi:hypothetical protein
MKRMRTVVMTLALLALVAGIANSATVLRFGWEELAQRADRIVEGTVTHTDVHWNDAKTKIYTDAYIKVTSTLKGQPAETLVVRQLGGELDGIGAMIPGSPRYAAGEELIVFAEDRPDGAVVTLGLFQGKCVPYIDTDTGVKMVRMGSLNKAEAPAVRLVGDDSQAPMSYNELLQHIAAAAGN